MRTRQVVVLWLVAALLGAWYWFVERQAPVAAPEATRQRFLPLEAAALREVRLRRPGLTVVTRRDGGAWVIVEPKGAFVPSDLIAAFASALTSAEEIALVAQEGADTGQFGLDDGASHVEIVPESGDPLLVTLGQTNPTGTAVYARRGGATDVVLVGRNIRYYEDLIFQAVSAGRAPSIEQGAPVGG